MSKEIRISQPPPEKRAKPVEVVKNTYDRAVNGFDRALIGFNSGVEKVKEDIKKIDLKKKPVAAATAAVLGVGGAISAPFIYHEARQNFVEQVEQKSELEKKAAQEFNERYGEWRAKFMTTDGAKANELRVQRGSNDGFDTVSEGQAYGMVIELHKGNKADFDKLWNYAKRQMAEKTAYKMGVDAKKKDAFIENNGLLKPGGMQDLMPWRIQKDGTIKNPAIDYGAATDADLDIAEMLRKADMRWGREDSSYKKDAHRLINLIMQREVEKGTNLLKPGDTWGGSGKEGRPGMQYDPQSDIVNISYYRPSYYEEFYKYTKDEGWKKVKESSRQLIDKVYATNPGAAETGLLPNWTTGSEGTGKKLTEEYRIWAKDDVNGYDSCRVPLFQTLGAKNGDKHAEMVLKKQVEFFKKQGPAGIVDGYKLDGKRSDTGQWNVPAFVSTAAVGAYAVGDEATKKQFLDYAIALRKQPEKDGYYHESLHLLSMLAISGELSETGGKAVSITNFPTETRAPSEIVPTATVIFKSRQPSPTTS